MSSIMSRLPYMSRYLFWSITKHVRILVWSIAKHVRICQVLCLDYLTCLEFYFELLLNMLELLLMHIAIFSTIGQPWLASIQSSWRGRSETATGGSLLPRATPLLLPHVRRWEALAAAALVLLPRARRWEALAAATAPLLLHPMTPLWRWERCLLLWHAWRGLHF
jgi:hypothetical protein